MPPPLPFTLVVARFKEDISWLSDVLSMPHCHKVFLYFKHFEFSDEEKELFGHPKLCLLPLPNQGREGETYLQHIINHYDALPDHPHVFVQGNPFEHSPDLVEILRDLPRASKDKFLALSLQYNHRIPENLWLSDLSFPRFTTYYIKTKDAQCAGKHAFRDGGIVQMYNNMKKHFVEGEESVFSHFARIAGIPQPRHPFVRFNFGAIFAVPPALIRKNPRDVYERIRAWLLAEQHGGPQGYVLERAWAYLFTHESFIQPAQPIPNDRLLRLEERMCHHRALTQLLKEQKKRGIKPAPR